MAYIESLAGGRVLGGGSTPVLPVREPFGLDLRLPPLST